VLFCAHSWFQESENKPRKGLFHGKSENNSLACRLSGGEGGIRTPGTLSGTAVFKTACFNRSHTSPHEPGFSYIIVRWFPAWCLR
jgi:hypothetical protein